METPLTHSVVDASGEPEVVMEPEPAGEMQAQPIAAPLAEQPSTASAAATLVVAPPAAAPMPARGESEATNIGANSIASPEQAVGLAGLAQVVEVSVPRFPTATPSVPTATPTSIADATEATMAVAPLPVTLEAPLVDAVAPAQDISATLSLAEALALTVPVAAEAPIAPEQPVQSVQTVLAYPSDGVARTATVPILMYHYVSTPPDGADIYRRDLSVTPDLFAAQLDRLQAEGYTTISLYDFMAHMNQGAPLPDKPVILTFDDGYRDLYENALPALRDRGMRATVFVLTDFMDEGRPEYLTWEMAREMLAAGISIESHGRNHVSLRGKDNDYLIWQALGSAETIAYELGQRPHFVTYPAGEFDQSVIDIFASADYWAGMTTVQGATHSSEDPFRLTRIRVRGTTSPDDLARLLVADW
jgi:peptidoglycan/xylan/chitin deacetylase (PgdA/CDA1 family)